MDKSESLGIWGKVNEKCWKMIEIRVWTKMKAYVSFKKCDAILIEWRRILLIFEIIFRLKRHPDL